MLTCPVPTLWHPVKLYCIFPVIQNELMSVFERLSTEVWDKGRKSSDDPLLVMDPRKLVELLQICTYIAQGQQHSYF